MKLSRLLFFSVLIAAVTVGCNNDDDRPQEIPIRDRGEQAIADDEALISYLRTHFYNYEEFENPPADFDYIVRFDTIAGANSNRTPIIESNALSTKIVTDSDIDYTIYILKIREGEGPKPTFADSAYVKYNGTLLNRTIFEANTVVPLWLNFPGSVVRDNQGRPTLTTPVRPGFVQALTEFGEASSYVVNEDNTISWTNDFGIGAVFLPSGLGYFNRSEQNIPPYNPLVYSFNLLRTVEADHDGDGIPSWMEDLNGDGNLLNDDTNNNGIPNYADADDDGDGVPTREEIVILPDGTLILPDTTGDGVPDYLDPNTFDVDYSEYYQ